MALPLHLYVDELHVYTIITVERAAVTEIIEVVGHGSRIQTVKAILKIQSLQLQCHVWQEVLRFWLDKGVHGVRVDAVESLYEVLDLEDEAPSGLTNDSVSAVVCCL